MNKIENIHIYFCHVHVLDQFNCQLNAFMRVKSRMITCIINNLVGISSLTFYNNFIHQMPRSNANCLLSPTYEGRRCAN